MVPILNFPIKVIQLFIANVSPDEIACGICMGMFLGFIPLNGSMALLLFFLWFFLKINKVASIIVLPFFKLAYILGVSRLADLVGGVLLIDAKFLAGFWKWVISLPIIAFLDLNNTMVTGGLVISIVLFVPVYLGAKKGIIPLRAKYLDRIKNSKFVKWFMKIPLVEKVGALMNLTGEVRGI